MEIDGVSGEVVYPSQGIFYFSIQDSELLSAVFRTYNDWLAEFCVRYPDRLKGIAMVNVDDVQDAIGELKRTVDMGLVGAMINDLGYKTRPYEVNKGETDRVIDEAKIILGDTLREGRSVF